MLSDIHYRLVHKLQKESISKLCLINKFELSYLSYFNKLTLFSYVCISVICLGLTHGSAVKKPPASAGDVSLTPGSGRSPGGGHNNPLQFSCLEKPVNRGAFREDRVY